MNRMADYYENDNKVRSKVKGAMTYPAAILSVTIIVVVFLIRNVVPTFVGMMDGSGTETPLPTKIVLGLSNALQANGLVMALVLIAIIIGIIVFAKNPQGKYFFDTLIFKLPILGQLNKKVITSRFARTLSILISSGLPIIQSIDILQNVIGNVRVSESLERTREELQKGKGFAKPISEVPYFHSMLHQMIAIGEETGSLDSMLIKTADMYEYEVEQAIQKAMTLMEPAIIVVIGAVVGFIVIAMILPVFSMYNSTNMN
jgi:type IV pilus assembly protein PilC